LHKFFQFSDCVSIMNMSKTFFDGESKFTRDTISLTRFAGQGGHALQIHTRNFMQSLDCPEEIREKQFLPGWSNIRLNQNEVRKLRDELNRFLEGVRDSDEEHTF